jgi:hypothetical protein
MATFEIDVGECATGVNPQAVRQAEHELELAHEAVVAAAQAVLDAELGLAAADARLAKVGKETYHDASRKAGAAHQKARCESAMRAASLDHGNALAKLRRKESALEQATVPLVRPKWGDMWCLGCLPCSKGTPRPGEVSADAGHVATPTRDGGSLGDGTSPASDRALAMLSSAASTEEGEEEEVVVVNPVAALALAGCDDDDEGAVAEV